MSISVESKVQIQLGTIENFCRGQVLKRFEAIRDGRLLVREGHQLTEYGQGHDLIGELQIHDAGAWADIALGGSIAAGEAFMSGHWSSPDLTSLVRLLARNIDVLDQLESSSDFVMQPLRRVLHWRHRNSRGNAKNNIHAHYDLGNGLFARFLDPQLMYSSAVYPEDDASLDDAALYKLKLIGDKLDLQPSDHLLEIGTGWGGLAIYMAKHYGCRVTTTTISEEQYQLAKTRIAEAGLSDRITLLKSDYRDLQGSFDKLVSVEMVEAVGLDYLPEYFGVCSRLLKSDGAMLLQAITIAEQRYAYAATHVDFIQKYIFPGGALPSSTRILECVRDHTDVQLRHVQDIGLHYARTLQDWRARFEMSWSAIHALGYDERFRRMWFYYLCYCEGGFRERSISCGQYLFHKPRCRSRHP